MGKPKDRSYTLQELKRWCEQDRLAILKLQKRRTMYLKILKLWKVKKRGS